MLIPGKSHSRDESRNSRVSIETLDFARVLVRTFTCVIRVGSPVGVQRGRGDHRLDPASFPADDGTPSLRAINIAGSGAPKTAGGVRGSATGEVQRPPDDGPGNHRLPPADVAGQSVDLAGRMGTWNGGQWPGLRRRGAPVKKQTCSATEGLDRRPDAGYGRPQACHRTWPDNQPTLRRSAHWMSALTRVWTVIFLVSYIEADWSGRICTAGPTQWHKWLSAHGSRNICSLCPLPLRYATVVCFTASASVRLVCRPRPPSSNKRSSDSKCWATGDNYPAHNRPIVGRSRQSRFSEVKKFLSRDWEKNRDSRLSSLVNIPNVDQCVNEHVFSGVFIQNWTWKKMLKIAVDCFFQIVHSCILRMCILLMI